MDKIDKILLTLFVGAGIATVVGTIALYGAIAYVAGHFIHKIW